MLNRFKKLYLYLNTTKSKLFYILFQKKYQKIYYFSNQISIFLSQKTLWSFWERHPHPLIGEPLIGKRFVPVKCYNLLCLQIFQLWKLEEDIKNKTTTTKATKRLLSISFLYFQKGSKKKIGLYYFVLFFFKLNKL